MGRKHRRASEFLAQIEFDEHARELRDTFDEERRRHEEARLLNSTEQVVAWNNARASNSPVDRAIARTVVCQMPKCERPAIYLGGASLGICYPHGSNVAQYFDINGEDFRNQVAKVDRIERAAWKAEKEARRVESRRITPGWIYYLHVGDLIKIGYTKEPKRRLKEYPPHSPLLAMHPGTKELESSLHREFAGSKAAGREWFLDTEEMRDHIKRVVGEFGEPDRARYEHHGKVGSKLRAAPAKRTGLSI